jgi:hypothetical protein
MPGMASRADANARSKSAGPGCLAKPGWLSLATERTLLGRRSIRMTDSLPPSLARSAGEGWGGVHLWLSSKAQRGACHFLDRERSRSRAFVRCARESLSVTAESNQRPLRRTLAETVKLSRYPALLTERGPARTRASMRSNMRALLPRSLPVLGSLYGTRAEDQGRKTKSSNAPVLQEALLLCFCSALCSWPLALAP